MKNILIIVGLCIVSLLPQKVQSQTRIGIKGGVDRSNIRFYHPFSSSRFGFIGGVFAYIPIDDAESFYFQPEVVYMQHGEKNVGNYSASLYVSEKYYIDYISVPLMLKKYVSDNYDTFFVEVGPQFAFKIRQRSTSNLSQVRAYADYGDGAETVAFLDFSIGLGIGFTYERQWELGLRYNFGLSDVYPDAIGENNAKTNNSHTFALTLNYIFD